MFINNYFRNFHFPSRTHSAKGLFAILCFPFCRDARNGNDPPSYITNIPLDFRFVFKFIIFTIPFKFIFIKFFKFFLHLRSFYYILSPKILENVKTKTIFCSPFKIIKIVFSFIKIKTVFIFLFETILLIEFRPLPFLLLLSKMLFPLIGEFYSRIRRTKRKQIAHMRLCHEQSESIRDKPISQYRNQKVKLSSNFCFLFVNCE